MSWVVSPKTGIGSTGTWSATLRTQLLIDWCKIIWVEGWGNRINIWEGVFWLVMWEKVNVLKMWTGSRVSEQGLTVNIDRKWQGRKLSQTSNDYGIMSAQRHKLPYHTGSIVNFFKILKNYHIRWVTLGTYLKFSLESVYLLEYKCKDDREKYL